MLYVHKKLINDVRMKDLVILIYAHRILTWAMNNIYQTSRNRFLFKSILSKYNKLSKLLIFIV